MPGKKRMVFSNIDLKERGMNKLSEEARKFHGVIKRWAKAGVHASRHGRFQFTQQLRQIYKFRLQHPVVSNAALGNINNYILIFEDAVAPGTEGSFSSDRPGHDEV